MKITFLPKSEVYCEDEVGTTGAPDAFTRPAPQVGELDAPPRWAAALGSSHPLPALGSNWFPSETH